MKERFVRRSDMVPCKSAFIDTYTPGSHLKDNFSIIGPGVTENPEQVVNIREPHGFNTFLTHCIKKITFFTIDPNTHNFVN